MSSPQSPQRTKHTRRAPTQSVLYDRLVPIIFVLLAIVMVVLILIASGVLLGIIKYQ